MAALSTGVTECLETGLDQGHLFISEPKSGTSAKPEGMRSMSRRHPIRVYQETKHPNQVLPKPMSTGLAQTHQS